MWPPVGRHSISYDFLGSTIPGLTFAVCTPAGRGQNDQRAQPQHPWYVLSWPSVPSVPSPVQHRRWQFSLVDPCSPSSHSQICDYSMDKAHQIRDIWIDREDTWAKATEVQLIDFVQPCRKSCHALLDHYCFPSIRCMDLYSLYTGSDAIHSMEHDGVRNG